MKEQKSQKARLATLDELLNTIIPNFLSPVPSRYTVREWLRAAKIPKFKVNPAARRGGGTAFYSVSHVEKFLTTRTINRLAA